MSPFLYSSDNVSIHAFNIFPSEYSKKSSFKKKSKVLNILFLDARFCRHEHNVSFHYQCDHYQYL